MRLRWYQYLELLGTVLLVASTAVQLFILEPTLRKNDQKDLAWKLTQTVQNTRVAAALDNVLILEAMQANEMNVSQQLSKLKTGILANKLRLQREIASNASQTKTTGVDEETKRYITLGAFLLGSLFVALGRIGHLRTES
jgi:hypothetical protein